MIVLNYVLVRLFRNYYSGKRGDKAFKNGSEADILPPFDKADIEKDKTTKAKGGAKDKGGSSAVFYIDDENGDSIDDEKENLSGNKRANDKDSAIDPKRTKQIQSKGKLN